MRWGRTHCQAEQRRAAARNLGAVRRDSRQISIGNRTPRSRAAKKQNKGGGLFAMTSLCIRALHWVSSKEGHVGGDKRVCGLRLWVCRPETHARGTDVQSCVLYTVGTQYKLSAGGEGKRRGWRDVDFTAGTTGSHACSRRGPNPAGPLVLEGMQPEGQLPQAARGGGGPRGRRPRLGKGGRRTRAPPAPPVLSMSVVACTRTAPVASSARRALLAGTAAKEAADL